MPSVTVRQHCPALIFVRPRFEVYKQISRHIQTIFADHIEIIESLSLDEEIATMIRRHNKAGP
jgi:DNA polymerase IV